MLPPLILLLPRILLLAQGGRHRILQPLPLPIQGGHRNQSRHLIQGGRPPLRIYLTSIEWSILNLHSNIRVFTVANITYWLALTTRRSVVGQRLLQL